MERYKTMFNNVQQLKEAKLPALPKLNINNVDDSDQLLKFCVNIVNNLLLPINDHILDGNSDLGDCLEMGDYEALNSYIDTVNMLANDIAKLIKYRDRYE